MGAKNLLKLYQNKGWDALVSHPELPLQSKSLMLLAIENEHLSLAENIFSRATPLAAMNTAVFAACSAKGYWDLADLLVDTVPSTDMFAHKFMATQALMYQKFDVVHNVLKKVENKNFIAHILLQECAKQQHDELFEQLIEYITPQNQDDLCEYFLWRFPTYAEKMINHVPNLLPRMMSHDLEKVGRENLEQIAAQIQKQVLLQKIPEKANTAIKKM